MFGDEGLTYSTNRVYQENEEIIDLTAPAVHNRENFDKAFIEYAYEYFENSEYTTDLVVLLKSLMYFAKSDPKDNNITYLTKYRKDWIGILDIVKNKKYEEDYRVVVLKFVNDYFENKNKSGYDFINKEFFKEYWYNKSGKNNVKDILKGCVPFYKDNKYIPTGHDNIFKKIRRFLGKAGSRRRQKRKSKRKSTKRRTKRKLRRKNVKK